MVDNPRVFGGRRSARQAAPTMRGRTHGITHIRNRHGEMDTILLLCGRAVLHTARSPSLGDTHPVSLLGGHGFPSIRLAPSATGRLHLISIQINRLAFCSFVRPPARPAAFRSTAIPSACAAVILPSVSLYYIILRITNPVGRSESMPHRAFDIARCGMPF